MTKKAAPWFQYSAHNELRMASVVCRFAYGRNEDLDLTHGVAHVHYDKIVISNPMKHQNCGDTVKCNNPNIRIGHKENFEERFETCLNLAVKIFGCTFL